MENDPLQTNPFFSWQRTFAALKYRNYRLWFIGQMISLFGTWMQGTAQGFLVFQLTRSPAYLGYVSFASGVPTWLFTPYGGVIADRMSRRSLLLITQSLMMLQAFVLAGLTFLNWVQPWHIFMLAFGLGLANAFDAPARLSIVPEMVEHKDLTNAIAMNATMFNMGSAIGPAVAGLVYALFGPGWCFTLNGFSFIAVISALLMIKLKSRPAPDFRASALSELKEGVKYVISQQAVRTLIAIVGMTSLLVMSFSTLFPAWAVKVLGGDATTNGLLLSARGLGSLLGALFIASLGRFQFKGKLLTLGTFCAPALLIIFSWLRWLPLSLLLLIGVGAAAILVVNLANSLVQILVPDHLRGRVMAIYSLIFMGFMPLGGLIIGSAAEHIGEPPAIIFASIIFLGFSSLICLKVPAISRLK